jgi:hypothetical protein
VSVASGQTLFDAAPLPTLEDLEKDIVHYRKSRIRSLAICLFPRLKKVLYFEYELPRACLPTCGTGDGARMSCETPTS